MTRQNPPADMSLPDIRRFAGYYKLEVETHAPGDGKRRFRFVKDGHSRGQVLGIREAEVWLRGYMNGADDMAPDRPHAGMSKYADNPDDDDDVEENPPRIVKRIGDYKVYWDSEFQEYEVLHERQRHGEGYFTADKQDAIDTAKHMASEHPKGYRYNPAEIELDTHVYGVFAWRGDGRYRVSDSVGNYRRESAAQKKADKLNEQNPNTYVVRELRYLLP